MSVLEDYRQKYPQYNDMSDTELATRLHTKFYNDIPFDNFSKKIGLNVPRGTIKSSPNLITQMAESAPTKFVNRAGASVARGLLDLPSSIGNLGAEAIQKLRGQPVHPVMSPDTFLPEQKDIGLARAAGNILSPAPGINVGSALLKMAPKIASTLAGKIGAGLGNAAATGGALSAAYSGNDPQNILQNTAKGAALGPLLHGATAAMANAPTAALKGIGYLAKKGSTLPAEEVSQRLKNIGNTPVNLGDITETPWLSKFYHHGAGIVPLSGVNAQRLNVIKAADEKTNQFLEGLKGGASEEQLPSLIKSEILGNREKYANTVRDKYYQPAKDLADAHNLQFDNLSNTKAFAKKTLDNYSSKPSAYPSTLDHENGLVSHLKGISEGDFSKRKVGNGKANASLANAIEARSEYGNFEHQAKLEGRNKAAAILGGLRTNLKKDIAGKLNLGAQVEKIGNNVSAKNSPYTQISKLLKQGDENYAKDVAPYSENGPIKILNSSEKDEAIPQTLLRPENKKLIEHLSPENRARLAYLHLAPTIKESEAGQAEALPERLFNKYDRLSENQKQLLFTPEQRQQLRQLKSYGAVSKESRANIKHARISDVLGGALLGTGYYHPLAIAKAAIPTSLLAKGMSKTLTSDALKHAYQGGAFPIAGQKTAKAAGKLGGLLPYLMRSNEEEEQQ